MMLLWDWTLKAYERPGVPEACLRLQDEHAQNTSFLLWAVWAAGVEPDRLEQGAAVARNWEAKVLVPIRKVRRLLKSPISDINDGAREGLRIDIKATELRGEQVLMEALESLGGIIGKALPQIALQRAAIAWSTPVPEAALTALALALE